jgi:diketogulonate reductase-like aldo/keto reductase
VIAIPKAEKVEHVREIAGALGWRLKEEDIRAL